jgi:hypothetical protein
MRQILFLILAAFGSEQLRAEVWYCDPVNGSTPTGPKDLGKGDGSRIRPWGSFESLVKAKYFNAAELNKATVKPGDTVKLLSGEHGSISFQGPAYVNSQTITVEAAIDATPVISQFNVKHMQRWTFRGITFRCPESINARFMLFRGVMVYDVLVDQCRFQSIEDANKWTDDDWASRCAQYGLWLSGANFKATANQFYAVENCIYVEGTDIEVDRNQGEWFLNDGIEHAASRLKITRNRFVDQYNLDANDFHHDGIQGWTLNNLTNSEILIEGNFIARSTGRYEAIPPVSDAVFQGISIFDGHFQDVTITNNVVMATASHAIALYGCVDSKISNNTVIYQGVTPNKPCWIGVFVGKPKWGSIEPSNIKLSKNIAPTYATNSSRGVELESNFSFKAPNKPWNTSFTIVDPVKTFVKFETDKAVFDLRVQPDSPAAGRVIRVDGAGAQQ